MGLFTKIFGTRSEREVKSLTSIVDRIEALSEEYQAYTDAQLQAKTPEFKSRLAAQKTPRYSCSLLYDCKQHQQDIGGKTFTGKP